jgi:hypothetical protein
MVKYTDITQNTDAQSWTVTKIMAREKCGFLADPHTVAISWQVLINVYPRVWYGVTSLLASDVSCIVLGNPNDNYDITASFFVAQFNGFM